MFEYRISVDGSVVSADEPAFMLPTLDRVDTALTDDVAYYTGGSDLPNASDEEKKRHYDASEFVTNEVGFRFVGPGEDNDKAFCMKAEFEYAGKSFVVSVFHHANLRVVSD